MQNLATLYHEGVAKARRSNVTSFSDIVAPCAAAEIAKQNLIKHPVPLMTFATAMANNKARLLALDNNLRTVIIHSHCQARETDDSPPTDLFAVSDAIDALSIASTDTAELRKFTISAQKGIRTQSAFTSYNISLDAVVKKGGGNVTYEDMKIPVEERNSSILFSLLPKVLPLAPGQYFPEGIHITDSLPADTETKRIDSVGREWFDAVAYTYNVNGAPLTCTTNGKLVATTTFTNDGNVSGGELSQDDKQELIDNGNMYQTFYGALDTSQLTDTFQVELTFLSPNSARVKMATPAIREAMYAKLTPWIREAEEAERAAAKLHPAHIEPSGPDPAPEVPSTGSTSAAVKTCAPYWRVFGCGLAADGQSVVPAELHPKFIEALSSKRGHFTLSDQVETLRLNCSISTSVPPQFEGNHMTRPLFIAMTHFRFAGKALLHEVDLDGKINVFNFVPTKAHDTNWARYRAENNANDADELYEPDAKKHAKKARGIFKDSPCENWTDLLTTLQNILLVLFAIPFADPTPSVIHKFITDLYDILKMPDHRTWFGENERSAPWLFHSILNDIQGRINTWLKMITSTPALRHMVESETPIADTSAILTMQRSIERFLQRIRDIPTEGIQAMYMGPDPSIALFKYGRAMQADHARRNNLFGLAALAPGNNPFGPAAPVPRDPRQIPDRPGQPDSHKRPRLDDLPPKELAARKRKGLLVSSGRGALPRFTAVLDKSGGKPPCNNFMYVGRACRHARASDCDWYHVPTWEKLSPADQEKVTAFVDSQPHISFAKNQGPAKGE